MKTRTKSSRFSPSITTNKKGVKQTAGLRNKVDDFPTKNPKRDVFIPGNGLTISERTALYVGHSPIIAYSEIIRDWYPHHVSKTLFNLTANTQGAFLAAREIMYITEHGKLMTYVPDGYTSAEALEKLLDTNQVSDVIEYSKPDAIAREAILKTKLRGIAAKVKDHIIHLLDTDLIDLLMEADHAFLVQTRPSTERTLVSHPSFSPRKNDIAQYAMDLMETENKFKDQLHCYKSALAFYKKHQRDNGITVALLQLMIDEAIPGHQNARKALILKDLINYFNLTPPPGQPLLPPKPIRPPQPNKGLMVRALTMSPDEESDHARCAVKHAAAEVFVHDLQHELDEVTEKVRENLQSYDDKDAIDTRQRAKMLSEISPLPLSYVDKSMTSPRLYSEQADNLFACRKDMRLAALKGLGAVDVDMKSCHTYILLAKWPQQLPLLKEAMETETLWDMYKAHYEAEGYPFHKKAVKAMHYASVLGGGKDAFNQAIHRHNLDNPNEHIINPDELIKIHRKSPIFKELKKLLSHIEKEWHGKELTLSTGEKFRIKGIRRTKDKDTGEVTTHYGNLLTALSAFLQSKEVLLMSYLILKTRGLYTPLLFQHDGLTIIPRDRQYLKQMQQVMDEACSRLLDSDIRIPLEVFHIK